MSFEHPLLFFMLAIPLFAFAYLVLTNKSGIERVFSKETLREIRVESAHLNVRARNFLLFLSAFFMIVAISSPYIPKGDINVKVKGQDIAIALDLSSSMRLKDRYPNRLEFAKSKIDLILDKLNNDEVTMLTFSDAAYLISPSTTDKETIKEVLSAINVNYVDKTADYKVVAKAFRKIFKNKLTKTAIIVTDTDMGKKGIKDFEEIIKDSNIRVYILYVATKKGAAMFDKNGKLILKNDKLIMSKLKTTLGDIVKKYGGNYAVADYSNENLEKMIQKIKSNKFLNENKEIMVKNRVHLFYYPLILAFILLISALSSIPRENVFKFDLSSFKVKK